MACKICELRRPKRFCPAVRAEICPLCCGLEREMTLDCPLDCEYLQASRKHDRAPDVNPADFPNQDIQVSDTFLREHDALLVALGRAVLQAGLETPGAVDSDVAEALSALIRTYRTLESGLVYESRPDNRIAAELCRRIQASVAEFQRLEAERLQVTRTRDSDVMRVLAFLQRFELDRNNGRKRGRAFLDFLRHQLPDTAVQSAGSLIV